MLTNLNRLRVLAALGIVCYHVHVPYVEVQLGAALGILLMITCLLNAKERPEPESFGQFSKRRASRLLVPWLFWSAVYGTVYGVQFLRRGSLPGFTLKPYMVIVGGPAPHLWYLTYAFAAALLMFGARRCSRGIAPTARIVFAGLLGAFLIPAVGLLTELLNPRDFLELWVLCFPNLPLGFAQGQIFSLEDKRKAVRLYAAMLAAVLVAAGVLALMGGHAKITHGYAISTTLLFLALIYPGREGPVTRLVAPLAFGIYLTHVLVFRVFTINAGIYAFQKQHKVIVASLVFLGAGLLTYIIRLTPLKRFV